MMRCGPYNHHVRWSARETKRLSTLLRQNTPIFVIQMKLGRSEAAIRSKAYAKGLSFRPTNQRPYAR
jgi:hypothetical protein